MSSPPAEWDLELYPGEHWERQFYVEGVDVSAAEWLMRVRRTRGQDLIVELSTANGRIAATYDGTDTLVVLTIPSDVTTTLAPIPARHNIQAEIAGQPEYYWEGTFQINTVVMT